MARKISRREAGKVIAAASSTALFGTAIAGEKSATPPQTEGPFYPINEQDDRDTDLVNLRGHDEPALGEQILVRGRVYNTKGQKLEGATVDIWQANHHGKYSHPKDSNPNPLDPNFQGWGIMQTGDNGKYGFKTIMPGAYDISEDSIRCKHIHFKVSHPDHKAITSQLYFEDDPLIEKDAVMRRTPEEKRKLLIAKAKKDEDSGLTAYYLDIVLA